MKKMILGWIALLLGSAQSAFAIDVTLTQAGTLQQEIERGGRTIGQVTELRLAGPLNSADIRYLRRMAGGAGTVKVAAGGGGMTETVTEPLGRLHTLDLSGVTFVADGAHYVEITGAGTSPTLTAQATLTTLPTYMLAGCDQLSRVMLPTTVTAVGDAAFRSCSSLTRVVGFGQNVTTVGNAAFRDCGSFTLSSPTNVSGITSLGEYAFYNCDALTEVSLSPQLRVISGYAFQNCDRLTRVNWDNLTSLETIAYRAFCDCHLLHLGEFHVPSTVTTIGDFAFANVDVSEVWFPENSSYTKINDYVFGWNSGGKEDPTHRESMKRIHIPANVTTIGVGSFETCRELVDVVVADEARITRIGNIAFDNCTSLPDAALARLLRDVTVINEKTFAGCTSLTEVSLPATIDHIRPLAFSGSTGIRKVTVNRGQAPACDIFSPENTTERQDPFYGIDPNKLTVDFAADAATDNHYVSYQKSETFARLLTKTLDEMDTTYDVAPQRHAIVKLRRTFKEGWNTLMLPFAAPNDTRVNTDGQEHDCSRIFQRALNPTWTGAGNDPAFMLAAYRGYRKADNVFTFMKYDDYDTWGIDAFEPILVKMKQADIDAAHGEYTFSNVDLNYDYSEATKQVTLRSPVSPKNFNGLVDVDKDHASFRNNDYQDYVFTGTFKLVKGDGRQLLSARDYYIQNGEDNGGVFYAYEDGKKYASRGFRGWFHYQGTAAGARRVNISIMTPEGSETLDIRGISDTRSRRPAEGVFSLDGRRVAASAQDLSSLPRGIYIVNGKKVINK